MNVVDVLELDWLELTGCPGVAEMAGEILREALERIAFWAGVPVEVLYTHLEQKQ